MSQFRSCERCAGQAKFSTEIQPLGHEPGYRLYYCEPCKHYTWDSWRGVEQPQKLPQE